MSSQLEVRDLSVAYRTVPVVRGVSFALEPGQIGCLLGPSGCGKTTLLRAIAGFEPVRSGHIRLHGVCVSRPGLTVPPERRGVGMVFQDLALFPHLTVSDNIGFGLRRISSRAREARIEELLGLIELRHARRQYPHELSGGMQQRVAVARAIAPRPEILLLDEPFSNIDAERREQLARGVRAMLKREGVTAILVTHDQLEAFAMADTIGVLGNGEIHQWDSGFRLYHEPADRFVADFIGQGALIPGRVLDGERIATELGELAGHHPHGLAIDSVAEVLIRPDDLFCDDSSPIRAVIVDAAFRGPEFLYTLRLASGIEVLCLEPSRHYHGLGEEIGIRAQTRYLVAFPLR